MGRPLANDDTKLLEIIADLLVSGEAGSDAEAQRKAASFIPGCDNWQPQKKTQLFDRVGKKYADGRIKFEQDARERLHQRTDMSGFLNFFPLLSWVCPGIQP
jgi:hypothetical protein